jgi:hypothetical protein
MIAGDVEDSVIGAMAARWVMDCLRRLRKFHPEKSHGSA